MKRITLIAVMSLALASCSTLNTQPVGKDLEKARIAGDEIYVHAVHSGAVLVQQGVISEAKYRELSEEAYQILLKVRVGQSTLGALTASVVALEGGSK
jgi:predicted small secreted protein